MPKKSFSKGPSAPSQSAGCSTLVYLAIALALAFSLVQLSVSLGGSSLSVPEKKQGVVPPMKHYYQLGEEIINGTKALDEKDKYQRSSFSAYSIARVVKQRTSWFPKRKQCKETCCVETVAISLDQDEHKIINTQDGRDLADLRLEHYATFKARAANLKYHASHLKRDVLPCLVPGTIIWIENHEKGLNYFWNTLRPKITVPYALVVSVSDGDTPRSFVEFLADPLLIQLYGTNPKYPQEAQWSHYSDKFRGIPLGLGHRHNSELHLYHYLKLTHFRNPFLDKTQWDFTKQPFHWDRDVFVHFGLHRTHRKVLWEMLCPNPTTLGSSCNTNTNTLPIHTIFTDMSKYRFGISPTGYGWDCFRTVELLLLGVIPVIEERAPDGYDLYEGLPVVHMPNMAKATSKQDFVDVIQKYIASDAFQKATFDRGWEKLFLKYKRQQLLKDTGRDKEILVDEDGRQYYQAYYYTLTNPQKDVYCSEEGNCEIPGKQIDKAWMENPVTELTQQDKDWLATWDSGKSNLG